MYPVGSWRRWNNSDQSAGGIYADSVFIHSTAYLALGAVIAEDAIIGEHVIVDNNAVIRGHVGANTYVREKAFVDKNAHVGKKCLLAEQVILKEGVYVPDGSILAPGTFLTPGDTWITEIFPTGLVTLVQSLRNQFKVYCHAFLAGIEVDPVLADQLYLLESFLFIHTTSEIKQ
jgi:UDP-3-O-[3-hydroxymyristoyl] glucosamine N-acyltransferase